MKRILISALLILSLVAFTTPAFAFLDDNSTNANANVTGVNAGATSNNYVTFPESKDLTTTDINAKGYRGFPIGPQMTYPGFPTYFNGATDGASVTNLEDFLTYGNVWDIATLEAMASGGVFDFIASGYKVVTVAECPEGAQPEKVKALLKKQVNGKYKRVATITVKATNLNTTSERLLARAALEGAKYGASEIHIIDSGKHRVMTGEGWGIGIYYYAAGLSASESSGQMGGGGTGYSTGESGYQDKPWIKVIAVIPAK